MSDGEFDFSFINKEVPVRPPSPPEDMWSSSEEEGGMVGGRTSEGGRGRGVGRRGRGKEGESSKRGLARGGKGGRGGRGGRARGGRGRVDTSSGKGSGKSLPSVKNVFDDLMTKSFSAPLQFVPPGYKSEKKLEGMLHVWSPSFAWVGQVRMGLSFVWLVFICICTFFLFLTMHCRIFGGGMSK